MSVLGTGIAIADGDVNYSTGLGFTTALHHRFSRHLAWELGYFLSAVEVEVHDNKFLRDNGLKGGTDIGNRNGVVSDMGNFDFAKWYQAGSVSFYYFFSVHANLQPYIRAGLSYNSLLSKQNYFQGTYTYLPTGQELQMSARYQPQYLSEFVEMGLAYQGAGNGGYLKKTGFFMGVRLHFAGTMFSGDYQSNMGGVNQYRDHISPSGPYPEVTLRIPIVGFACDNFKKDFRHHHRATHRYSRKKKIKNTKKIPAEKDPGRDNTRGY